jgi:hypothetical protein
MSAIVNKALSSQNLTFDEDKILLVLNRGFIIGNSYFTEETEDLLKKISFNVKTSLRCLILFNIFIPENLRKNGLCKNIIENLEKHCVKNNLIFVVGPILSDENDESILSDFLDRRKYRGIMPFGAVYTGNLKNN